MTKRKNAAENGSMSCEIMRPAINVPPQKQAESNNLIYVKTKNVYSYSQSIGECTGLDQIITKS